MSWLHNYHNRIVSAEEAVESIQSENRVFLTGNSSVPQVVIKALVERAMSLSNVELVQVLTIGSVNYTDPKLEGHLRVNTLFVSENVSHR